MGESIMKNDLKSIYFALPAEMKNTTRLMDSEELVKWIPVLPCGEAYRSMGISENGCWVVKVASGLCELTESNSYMYAMILLEQTMSEIRSQLTEFFNCSDIPIDLDSVFPFREIVQFGLEQRDEYWVGLAFDWYECLPSMKKKSLQDSLEKLAKSKRASQKLRQRASKEVGSKLPKR
jgi:hypothetical protein